jgi:hypothetical protein
VAKLRAIAPSDRRPLEVEELEISCRLTVREGLPAR